MNKILRDEDVIIIQKHYKNDFLKILYEKLNYYADEWMLDSFIFVPYFSPNCIFKCQSNTYGDAILKIGNPLELKNEINALLAYQGRLYCHLYEYDIDEGVFLEERIEPGTPLRNIKSLETRLEIFCSLYKKLYFITDDLTKYPSYINWINNAYHKICKTKYLNLAKHMEKALMYVNDLSKTYSQQFLLHGDLHHDNIILDRNNKYRIIDPKGVVGNPIFDLGQFMINENNHKYDENLYNLFQFMIDYFACNLNIPNQVIRKCLYIQAVMTECWNVEDKKEPDLGLIDFVYRLLES